MIDETVKIGHPRHVMRRGTAIAGLVALLIVMLVGGCSNGDDVESPTTQVTEETTAPAEDSEAPADDESSEAEEPSDGETTPPDDEEPADEATEPDREPAEVPVWSWVVAGLLLLAAVVWMATRSGSASVDDEAESG